MNQDLEKTTDPLSVLEAHFEPELLGEIRSSCTRHSYREGDVIMDYGRKIRFMPLVLKGTVKVLRRDENNREILLYYLSASESCAMAYACCMEDKKSGIRAIAEEETEVIAIPHQKLDEWLLKFPRWKQYVFHSFSRRFDELLHSLESVAFNRLDQRLVRYLKQKARVGGRNTLKLSHNEIAEDLGTSRVVISRLLKQLENDQKLILYRNEIKLLSDF